jgi:hypothetical protein
MVTAGELAAAPGWRGGTTTFLGGGPNGAGPVSRFVVEPLDGRVGRSGRLIHRPPRSLLVEWVPGQQRPAGIWVTNLGSSRLPETVELTRTGRGMLTEVIRLHEDFGLGDFEGRSFRGWNHHVTLVSLAHGYAVCQRRVQLGQQVFGPSYA